MKRDIPQTLSARDTQQDLSANRNVAFGPHKRDPSLSIFPFSVFCRLSSCVRKRTFHSRNQQGSALVLALLVMLVMSIVIMGMATDSDLDLKISRNLELKNQAFNNAETGVHITSGVLRHVIVNRYWEEENSTGNITIGDYELKIQDGGGDIENIYEQDETLELEHDGKKIAEIKVNSRAYSNEDRRWFSLVSKGFNVDNAESQISVVMEELDVSMNLNSPLSLLNPDPKLTLKGNSYISNKNHNVPDDFYCNGADCTDVSDSVEGESEFAVSSNQEITLEEIGQDDNGIDGDIGHSSIEIEDDYWSDQVDHYESIAEANDRVYEEEPDSLGTREEPMVTVLEGVDISSSNGAGILILKGGARITGNAHFEGLVICIVGEDEDSALFSGGTNTLFGGMVVLGDTSEVELEEEGDEVELAGNPSIKYSTQALTSAMGALDDNAPMRQMSWRAE